MIRTTGYTSSEITDITNIFNKYLSFGLCTEDKIRGYIKNDDTTLATTEVDGDIASIIVAKTFRRSNMNDELKSLNYSEDDIAFCSSIIEGEQILTVTHAVTLPEYEGLSLVTAMVDHVMQTKNISETVSLAWINKEGLAKRLEEKYTATKLIKHYWEKDNYECNVCRTKCMCDAMLVYNKIELKNNVYAIDFQFDGMNLTKPLAEFLINKEFPENIGIVASIESRLFRMFNKQYIRHPLEDVYEHVVEKGLLLNDVEDLNAYIALIAYTYDQMDRSVLVDEMTFTDYTVIRMTQQEMYKTMICIWIKILDSIIKLKYNYKFSHVSPELLDAITSLSKNRLAVSKIIYTATVHTLANEVFQLKGLPSTFKVPAVVNSEELLSILDK